MFNQRYDHDHGYDPYERAIMDQLDDAVEAYDEDRDRAAEALSPLSAP